jgi:hypothetical protein
MHEWVRERGEDIPLGEDLKVAYLQHGDSLFFSNF